MRETQKKGIIVEFGDLSPSLKVLVVIGWIIITLWMILFTYGFITGLTTLE